MFDQTFLIALGGNMPSKAGAPEQTLASALAMLPIFDVKITVHSRLYATPCFPAGAGPEYVNAAAEVAFEGTPRALLDVLHQVEAEFGRERAQRWGQRCLDLDLIAAGDRVLPDHASYEAWRDLPLEEQMQVAPGQMILPHPRVQERAFVLVPLHDVAPDWQHPVLGQTVAQMLAALPRDAVAEVVALPD